MSKEIVYWKQKNGKSVSVDDMDTNHIKNAFKMLIRYHSHTVERANELLEKYNALIRKRKAERDNASFTLNGDIASFFNEECDDSLQNEYFEENCSDKPML